MSEERCIPRYLCVDCFMLSICKCVYVVDEVTGSGRGESKFAKCVPIAEIRPGPPKEVLSQQ